MILALTGGRVIDGSGKDPLERASILVEDGKILAVTADEKFGADVVALDISGSTVMPGIIDTHVHFGWWFQWLIDRQQASLSYLMAETALNMRSLLETGVTSARDMGGLESGFCAAQADGIIPGPRTRTVCTIIQSSNGLTDLMPGVGGTITPQGLTSFLPGLPSPWADGVDAVRAKVREVLRFGADDVKCAQTPVPWTNPKLRPDRPLFTQEELDALVDEAHRAGVQVCCHVFGYEDTEATLSAIRAGVDLIDHGPLLDDECIDEMVDRGTWYCPMFSITDFHRARNPNLKVRPIAEKVYKQTGISFRKAVEAGVRVCMGTDQGAETGWHGPEMVHMVENGMKPMEVIVASTRAAAEALRMDHIVGTLLPGKEADLLVVAGDPLTDMRLLGDPRNLDLVMQAGRPVSGRLQAKFPCEPPRNLNFLPIPPTLRGW